MSLFPRPIEPDGLVIEDESGNRLLAVPTQLLEILRFAAVIQYTRGGSVFRFRVSGWTDPGPVPGLVPHQPQDPSAGVRLVAVANHSPATPPPLRDTWECPNPECMIRNEGGFRCGFCAAPRPHQG